MQVSGILLDCIWQVLSQTFTERAELESGLEGANTLYSGKGEDNDINGREESKKLRERKLQERIYSQQCQVCLDVLESREVQLMLLESLYRMITSREEYGKQGKKKRLSLCQMFSPAYCQRSEILCLCCWVMNSKKHQIKLVLCLGYFFCALTQVQMFSSDFAAVL